MIKQNPFLSESFISIWLKHFTKKNTVVKVFKFITDLQFVKHSNSLVYTNVGATHTKAVSYTIESIKDFDLENQTLLVYDVPTYFNIDTTQLGSEIKLLKSRQYPGFLIEISKYKSLNDYMLSNFSRKSRSKNNKYKRRLELSFDIKYKMFFGEISKEEYDFIFTKFRLLLEKRFAEKGTTNNNLDPEEWCFYNDVSYKLILEKKASLYVIYNGDQPIGVTLSFFSESTLFDAITVFDIDYFKFHLGTVTIMKLIEWCIENSIQTFDFSKGYFEYKTHWCTKKYDFEYHIYYDNTSLKSKGIATSTKRFYDFKQKMREKNLKERLQKLKNKNQNVKNKLKFSFTEIDLIEVYKNLTLINHKLYDNKDVRLMIFEFLYLYQENYNNIEFFQIKNKENRYLIKGVQKSVLITINN